MGGGASEGAKAATCATGVSAYCRMPDSSVRGAAAGVTRRRYRWKVKMIETAVALSDAEEATSVEKLPVNIFELGLVYEIQIGDNNSVDIIMTLTATACPVAGDIIFEVQQKVSAIEGVSDAHVQLTFDPPWTKDMMSEEARLELGFM